MAMLLPDRPKNGSIFFTPHFEMDNFVDERQEELHSTYWEDPFSYSLRVGRRCNGCAKRHRDTRAGCNGRAR
ncbi:hypothetical protein Pcaca04_33920 [Pectobacterium carotovorum subsp. carotovorum]|nr:hypothetical protein Pcaca04_33920 [Pectobacterium carotovorum subsp. carotovorum]